MTLPALPGLLESAPTVLFDAPRMTTPSFWALVNTGIPGSGPLDESCVWPLAEKIWPPAPVPMMLPATRFCDEPSETSSTPAMPLADMTLPGPMMLPAELLTKTPRSRFETGRVAGGIGADQVAGDEVAAADIAVALPDAGDLDAHAIAGDDVGGARIADRVAGGPADQDPDGLGRLPSLEPLGK